MLMFGSRKIGAVNREKNAITHPFDLENVRVIFQRKMADDFGMSLSACVMHVFVCQPSVNRSGEF